MHEARKLQYFVPTNNVLFTLKISTNDLYKFVEKFKIITIIISFLGGEVNKIYEV